ncbi:serine hydrolase, partial [Acinetobacter baumannii]
MQNTSGLRDQLEITRLGGMTMATPCTADDVLDGIFRQRTLNFVPGERFLYSNTNFRLLGMIVEAVEGRPLADVMAARLFEPLGMRQTRLV